MKITETDTDYREERAEITCSGLEHRATALVSDDGNEIEVSFRPVSSGNRIDMVFNLDELDMLIERFQIARAQLRQHLDVRDYKADLAAYTRLHARFKGLSPEVLPAEPVCIPAGGVEALVVEALRVDEVADGINL